MKIWADISCNASSTLPNPGNYAQLQIAHLYTLDSKLVRFMQISHLNISLTKIMSKMTILHEFH